MAGFKMILLVLLLLGSTVTGQLPCGYTPISQSRVIGGQDAKPGAWPWQIALQRYGRFICGGSLIGSDWVVTAAHCVAGSSNPANYKIVVGDHNRNTNEGTEETVGAKRIISHPQYNKPSQINNDIALIQLAGSVKLSQRVNPICLPSHDSDVPTGSKCYITGWGKIKHPGSSHPILQQAMMPPIDQGKCQQKIQASGVSISLTPQMLCAGVENTILSGCHGDSGGPYACLNSDMKTYTLHGAVSWGSGSCDASQLFSVFARVTQFRAWIKQHTGIGGGGGSPPPPATPLVPTNSSCGGSSPPPSTPPVPTTPGSSECSNYQVLNDSDRAKGFKAVSNFKCDQPFIKRWYKFEGGAGTQMPDQVVPTHHCGTHAPGWLNGSHPTVAEGTVQRKVCFHWSGNPCLWSRDIRVRNCGGFYVYELWRTPTCHLRYCGNNDQGSSPPPPVTTSPPTPPPPTTPTGQNECSNYQVLNDSDRAKGFKAVSNFKCDQPFIKRWYKFEGGAGTQMPDQVVPTYHCGTHAPGWLNGSHPTVAEGTVQSKVCFHWSGNPCLWSRDIRVRNCGGFYVYELWQTPACHLRYCGDNDQGSTTPPATTKPPVPMPTSSGSNGCGTSSPATPPPPTTPVGVQECSNYQVLNDSDRAKGFKAVSNYKCDRPFTLQWYKFEGDAGKQMPDKCVPKYHCGTHAPGWLNGAHPTVAEGSVQRQVCFSWTSGCCQWSINIMVRNCGAFYVYKLTDTPGCSMRYCGDKDQATPQPPTIPSTPPPSGIPPPQECSNYQVLNDSDRAKGFKAVSNYKCDRPFTLQWYKFEGDAGKQMPDKCVPKYHCGTHAPGWLNGAHPTVAEGSVQRQVCFSWTSGCCQWSINIMVRNCGAFYVYKLTDTPGCSMRYCGDKDQATPQPPTIPSTPPPSGIPPPQECSNYQVLNDSDRAKGFKAVSNYKCDRPFTLQWYKFEGDAGKQMPDKCVPKYHCGTHAPGWLNGAHPTVAEGSVQRQVCFSWTSGCCQWSINIMVRNCGAFYVYKLTDTPGCSMRYCGDKDQVTPPTPTAPSTSPPSGSPLPPGSCGIRPHSRIVGGVNAKHGDWPWQVQLRTTSGFPYCGGSLVSPQWVVTATHCVLNKSPSSIVIRLGAHRRVNTVGSEQDIKVSKVITHPSYHQPTRYSHDIALLKLEKPAQRNRFVNLVCLPQAVAEPSNGTKCWITGWGRLASGGAVPDYLQQVQVPVVSRARCDAAYPGKIHDSMVCAGLDQGGIDSCQGDSGGPMVCETGGRFYLHGVTSWGYGCASPGKFGVYAKVKFLLAWLNSEMSKN